MAKKRNIANARRNGKENVKAGLGRRKLLKMGLVTSAGLLIPKSGLSAWSQTCEPGSSPRIANPFSDPLPRMPILPERDVNTDPGFQNPQTLLPMPPQECPNHTDRLPRDPNLPFEGRGQYSGVEQPPDVDCFQSFPDYPVQKYFVQRMRANSNFRITSDTSILPQTIWGFNLGATEDTDQAIFPGPTIVSRYQEPIVVRRFNELPTDNVGFGCPEMSTHLHNFHSGPESDGSPCRYFFRDQYYDYYYAMQQAGFASTHPPNGDINESLSTLWYHDHRVMHTSENVYKGLAGFHLIFNQFDTGDENTGFHLPSFPNFDIPLMLNDKLIDPDTKLICFNNFSADGLVGDTYLVNGIIQPFLKVYQRRYRFRVLDGGPSRYYTLFLTNPDNLDQEIKFWVIANDGNLLPNPIQVSSFRLGVAERYDIIIDFGQIVRDNPSITKLRLENRLEQISGRGPTNTILPPGHDMGQGYLMEFRISPPAPDSSVDPSTMPHFYDLPDSMEMPRITRTFRFLNNGTIQDPWTINSGLMDCANNPPRFQVQKGTAEIWTIINPPIMPNWHHPIHIHLEEHQILRRNGVPIPPDSVEHSRKDVVDLGPGENIDLFLRFRDFNGDYPLHCHNTIHEDHAMMLLWGVAAMGDDNHMP